MSTRIVDLKVCEFIYRFLFFSFILGNIQSQDLPIFDVAIHGGRVIDPETGLNEVKNVAIQGGRIVDISDDEISGKININAEGLIVSPGFIDLHVHGMTNAAHKYQVRDGVTTALELEGGTTFYQKWIKSKAGKSIVNYGASAAHSNIRTMSMRRNAQFMLELEKIIEEEGVSSPKINRVVAKMARATYSTLSREEQKKMIELLEAELHQGALGIGVPVGYYLASTRGEIFRVYELAAKMQAPVFSHTRGFGLNGIQEAISNASITGAPLHIVHLNSLSLGEIDVALDMVSSAQKLGLDITTEIYPYTAASTSLQTVLFDEGWQEELGISYGDIQWEATGERLTKETFEKYRKQGGVVIIHMMKPEWITLGIQSPVTMIGSDGMPYAPGAHPRTAGTFSRVLGKYVREEKVISLEKALEKMTIMPAKRLENIAPSMRFKGRIQIGTDADITIFDPETVIDKATFEGLQFSEGIEYVLVNGELIVDGGELVEGIFPGKAVVGKYKR